MSQPVRLYVKARHVGFRRAKRNQSTGQSLIQIENVNNAQDTAFYLGKRIAYIYKTPSGIRVTWGRISRAHGNSGVVKAKFAKNLPARSFGASLRVMLYPSRV
ncbi:ribosomal protein L35Ae [Ramicandelaber brevisporus]|nr:ribosomal protein L35Ae [Ramicandelaber brevisporus]